MLLLEDLLAEEKERYKADIRATNILLQGIPKDIYSLINHYTEANDIWENVKMILEGSDKAYVVLNKETMKVEESLNVKLDETPPPSSPPLVDDDLLEVDIIEN
ncbi:hypothetical protein Tco_0694906 [Tanacetum coccineum]